MTACSQITRRLLAAVGTPLAAVLLLDRALLVVPQPTSLGRGQAI